jgi:glycosyltransferase involved in cell wall biosynthesis
MTSINVVVPFWNCSRWIARALQSLDEQTRKPDQVYVVNDASTDFRDETVETVREASRVWANLPAHWRYQRNA